MGVFRRGKKSSKYEIEFLHPFTAFIIPQDFGFIPRDIWFQILSENDRCVDFILSFEQDAKLYKLQCKYMIATHEMTYKANAQYTM